MPKKTTAHENRSLKTLERVFSKAGTGSRTDARKWIGAGKVRVNGKVILNPDHWVDLDHDKVTLDGKPLKAAAKSYILLYKPKGYLTTYRDPEGRPTVYALLGDVGKWLSPVGRRKSGSRRPQEWHARRCRPNLLRHSAAIVPEPSPCRYCCRHCHSWPGRCRAACRARRA